MATEWSPAQDGRVGTGGIIRYDPLRDEMTWRLPLHRQAQAVVLRLHHNGEVTVALVTGSHEGATEPSGPAE